MNPWQLRCLAVGVAGFAVLIKFTTGGWLMLVGWLIYPLLGLAHCWFHSRALPKTGQPAGADTAKLLGSHALFLLAILLQVDGGDGPSWLTLRALLGEGRGHPGSQPPGWWPNFMVMNLLVFVPVFVSWAWLKRRQHRLAAEG